MCRVWMRRISSRPRRSGKGHGDPPVEPSGAEQCGVEHVGAVGRRQHDDALVRIETVHLGEDLVQGLLLLVVAPEAGTRRTRPADGVELVDEDDRRRRGAGLLEQVAHPGRTDSDDCLDELRCGDGEERHRRLARHRAREQRLAGARRADEQDALRDGAAQALVFLRFLEKVDDLDQLGLDLVDPGDIGKGRVGMLGVVEARAALAEPSEDAAGATARERRASAASGR